jgi:hypothetical protein
MTRQYRPYYRAVPRLRPGWMHLLDRLHADHRLVGLPRLRH